MSVSTVGTIASYLGNGATTVFAIPFKFFAPTDIVVAMFSQTPPVQSATTSYSIVGSTVVFAAAPPIGFTIIIYAQIPETQPDSYVYQDNFPATSHELALDRLTMLVQQLDDRLKRAIRLPLTDLPIAELSLAARTNGSLGFDANGNLSLSNSGTIGAGVNMSIVNFTGHVNGCLDFLAIAAFSVSFILTIQPGGPGNALIRVQKVNTTAAAAFGVITTPPDYDAALNPYQWVTVG